MKAAMVYVGPMSLGLLREPGLARQQLHVGQQQLACCLLARGGGAADPALLSWISIRMRARNSESCFSLCILQIFMI